MDDTCKRWTHKHWGPHVHKPRRDHMCICGKPATIPGRHPVIEGRCDEHANIDGYGIDADGTIFALDTCSPNRRHPDTRWSFPRGGECPMCGPAERRRAAVIGGTPIPGVW